MSTKTSGDQNEREMGSPEMWLNYWCGSHYLKLQPPLIPISKFLSGDKQDQISALEKAIWPQVDTDLKEEV